MKSAALLAGFIGIILVSCSNGAPAAVEQTTNIDATVAAAVAATRTASDVQEVDSSGVKQQYKSVHGFGKRANGLGTSF